MIFLLVLVSTIRPTLEISSRTLTAKMTFGPATSRHDRS